MDKLQNGLRRRNGRETKPYFEENWEEEIAELVGFDPAGTEERFWDWLVGREYATAELVPAEVVPYLRGKPDLDGKIRVVFDVTLPIETEENSADIAKANALLREIHGPLQNLRSMYGPERLADMRWHDALARAEKELAQLRSYVDVRTREQSYNDSHLAESSRNSDHNVAVRRLSEEIRELTEALGAKVNQARDKIPDWQDGLPRVGRPGRPNRHFLADLETRLSLAGFGPKEIAHLVVDEGRIGDEGSVNHSADAQLLHRERIEGRIKSRKPALERERRNTERFRASFAAFKARRGRDRGTPDEIRQWLKEWFASPEAEALKSQREDETGGDKPGG